MVTFTFARGNSKKKRYRSFCKTGWYKFRILHSERGRSRGVLDAGTVLWNLSTRAYEPMGKYFGMP